jgi:hypothetical protein
MCARHPFRAATRLHDTVQASGNRDKMGKIMRVLVVCATGFGLLAIGSLVVSIPSVLSSPGVTMALYSVLLRVVELFLVSSVLVVLYQSKDFEPAIKWSSNRATLKFRYLRIKEWFVALQRRCRCLMLAAQHSTRARRVS